MNDSPHLDERYLEWLASHVMQIRSRDPRKTYWLLLEILYKTEFTWFVPNDDNRAADGLELREKFLDQIGWTDTDPEWQSLTASVLEVLVSLSQRCSFVAGRTSRVWFWTVLDNLGLAKYTDEIFHDGIAEAVKRSIQVVLDRTYDYDGTGGLFPLRTPYKDQRDVELWYQMQAYVLENDH